jgi:hypothetical protein
LTECELIQSKQEENYLQLMAPEEAGTVSAKDIASTDFLPPPKSCMHDMFLSLIANVNEQPGPSSSPAHTDNREQQQQQHELADQLHTFEREHAEGDLSLEAEYQVNQNNSICVKIQLSSLKMRLDDQMCVSDLV